MSVCMCMYIHVCICACVCARVIVCDLGDGYAACDVCYEFETCIHAQTYAYSHRYTCACSYANVCIFNHFLKYIRMQMDYQWFSNVPRTRSARPQSAVSASDYHRTRIPFRGESTHGADFLHWDSTRTRSVKGTATIHQRNIEQPYLSETRNFVTENSAKYNQKSLSKRAKERKKSMRPQTAGTQRIYQTRSLPFEGQSTNQADFQHWSRAKPARPTKTTRNIRLKKIRDGRSFVTENTSMYRKHRHRLCPAKALGTQTKSCSGHLMVVGNGRGGYKFKQRNGFR